MKFEKHPSKVVVVGGGVCGLTTGILLQSHGMDVTLVEQHSGTGGYLQGFSRGGLRFETGLHFLGACRPGETLARYLSLLGIYDELVFIEPADATVAQIALPDGQRFAVPRGVSAFVDRVACQFPADREGVAAVFRELANCIRIMSWIELQERAFDMNAYQAYATVSVDAVLRARISNPTLRKLLGTFCFSTAMSPRECPFSLFSVVTHSLLTGCTLQGGGRALTAALNRRFEALGGHLVTGNGAERAVVEQKRVTAMVLEDGRSLDADLVISTCHPHETIRVVGDAQFSPSFRENMASLRMSKGSFKVYAELNAPARSLGPHRTILCDTDWPDGIFVASPTAMDSPGDGRHSLEILVWQDFADVEAWQHSERGTRPAAYAAFKRATTETLLQRISSEFPDIPNTITRCHASTPLTNRDYTRSVRGAAMGVRQDIHQNGTAHIRVRNRLRNLYLMGQSVSCPGVAGVIIGATELCDGILGNDVDLFARLQAC